MAVIADVRWGGPVTSQSVIEVLQTLNLNRGRVGLAGRMPYLDHQALSSQLPDVTWVNAGQGYMSLRLIKSAEELTWLRQGAVHTDAAMAALVEAAQPGVSEYELAAAIEAAYTRHRG